jgi:hypothetical protein
MIKKLISRMSIVVTLFVTASLVFLATGATFAAGANLKDSDKTLIIGKQDSTGAFSG